MQNSKFILATGIAAILALSHRAEADLFSAGNLIVSRSTYTGVAGTVTFPGSLPNNAAATANGSFPSVFNNETPDPAFGVTSPIFIDQITTSGVLVGSPLDVTSLIASQLGKNVSTSFPSKSELGLSLTPDGTGVTFMAYGAAANQIDISNSNTPGHVDITNPVNGQGVLITQRDIVELSSSGIATVTTTNGYSGNNGRNVVLGANGNYYTVGNAGNNGSSITYATTTKAVLAIGSNAVALSGGTTTANLTIGAPFVGTGIPGGTTISSITDATHFQISANATALAGGSYTANTGAFGAAVTNASNNISLSGWTTANMYIGAPFSGTNVPTGAYVTSITSPTSFTINAPATATATVSAIANDGAFQLTGVSFGNGSSTVTVADTSKLVPGMPLTGTGFATGSYISTITGANIFTINTPTTAISSGTSYIASVSNSMLSDNTGVRMIQKGTNDTTGTGTGILDAVNSSVVVGKVYGTYGVTPGYQHGFDVNQLGVVLNGTTSSGSATITGLSPSVSAETAKNIQLYAGLPVTGSGIPAGTTILSVNPGLNTVTLSANATAGATSGLTFAPASDKSGKDDNFRGITNSNNTIYITKGSGGNGFDAVYQINPNGGGYVAPGSSAGLATGLNASLASINPLPGWPTGSTGANENKTNGTTVFHPFGIWFANDTTLYVADEGSGSITNAAPGGLEKWVYNGGTSIWELKYTLAASTIAGYVSGGLNLQALGLRNITGIDNGDGTVSIFGITSTTGQTLNDEGADPNQLVSITDSLGALTLPGGESFSVLETAAYGDVLRGVSVAPVPEPGCLALLGAASVLLARRRRQS